MSRQILLSVESYLRASRAKSLFSLRMALRPASNRPILDFLIHTNEYAIDLIWADDGEQQNGVINSFHENPSIMRF